MINNPNLTYNYGWVCPKCGRAMSPTATYCPCHNENVVHQTSGTSPGKLCNPQIPKTQNLPCPKCGGIKTSNKCALCGTEWTV